MAEQQAANANEIEENDDEQSNNVVKYTMWALGGLAVLIVAIFVIGLGLALLADPGPTATRIQVVRDVFIIIMSLQAIVIIVALAILVLQIARLINLLQNEIKPILSDTRETVDTAKGTIEFVGSNVSEPLIKASGFMAGLRVFVREVGGIRRAVRPSKNGRHAEEALPDET